MAEGLEEVANHVQPQVESAMPTSQRQSSRRSGTLEQRVERLESENELLKTNAEDDQRRIDELEERLRFLRNEQSPDAEMREQVFNGYQSEIGAYKRRVNSLVSDLDAERRRANFWEAEARKRGYEPNTRGVEDAMPVHT